VILLCDLSLASPQQRGRVLISMLSILAIHRSIDQGTRMMSCTQLVSQILPPSGE
jgi:hypothetical protein